MTPTPQLTKRIGTMLANAFDYAHGRRSQPEGMRAIIDRAPRGFGSQAARYRYDVFFLKEPLTAKAAIQHVSTNPAVDTAHAGPGVIYFLRLTAKGHGQPGDQVHGIPDLPARDQPQLEHDEAAGRADGVGAGPQWVRDHADEWR